MKEYEEKPEPFSDEKIDIKCIEKECSELSKYVEMDSYDFEGMYNYIRFNELKNEIKKHNNEEYISLGECPGEKCFENFLESKKTYERCQKFMEEYQIMDQDTYEKKKKKMETLVEEIETIDRAKEIIDWGKSSEKIKKRRIEIGKCNNKIEKAGTLCEKIETFLNKNLELFLIDFNNLLNEAISYLFEDMSVYISLYKKNKVNKKTKPCVNIEIIYKGNKYESFSAFSGGEKNRISLAFTLVFSKICKSKFIFLDEFMAFLNSERRVQCLKLIKDFCGEKIIVNVCHETVEGYYDNVFNF